MYQKSICPSKLNQKRSEKTLKSEVQNSHQTWKKEKTIEHFHFEANSRASQIYRVPVKVSW
jgi:hypothetical protein